MQPLAYIPSPSQSVWHLGPLPIRAYALCIVAGIIVALWLTARRMEERGGSREDVWDISGWAVVFGIVGGRIYHVITDPELYFEGKPGTRPIDAFKIWDGGLGIWGAVALGALGAWIGCRRKGVSLAVYADCVAPGLVLAQALGRWGNWFNNELYGDRTSLPWKLQIHCIDVSVGKGGICPNGSHVLGYFQPTFLYESLWDIGAAVLLFYLDRRFRMGHGTVIFTYAMAYTAGRGWIEAMRSDHANHILGLRLNDWTAIIVFIGALILFLRRGGFHAGREETPYTAAHKPDPATSEPEPATATVDAGGSAGAGGAETSSAPAPSDSPGD